MKIEITYIDSSGYDCEDLPEDCMRDCSAQGSVDSAIEFWVKELNLTAPIEGTKQYLRTTGAWEDSELQDHTTNLQRLLWLIACDQNENNKG